MMMDRKEISAFLIGCEPHQLMAFKDYGEVGVAAIGPDGKKYIYAAADLEKTNSKLEAAHIAAKPAAPPKPKSRVSGATTRRSGKAK